MTKYGEIGRIYTKDGIYRVGTNKDIAPYFIDEVFIPDLYFSRTIKSAKKKLPERALRCGDYENYDLKHSMIGSTFNITIIKKIITLFRKYFEEIKPAYVCFGVYDGEEPSVRDKRLKLYSKTISSFGYDFYKEYLDDYGWEVYLYKRR